MTASTPNPDALYAAHIEILASRWANALQAARFDVAVIGAGSEHIRYGDDQAMPYVPDPWFVQWTALTQHPGSALIVEPGRHPRLLIRRTNDYWHQPPALPGGAQARPFDIEVCNTQAGMTAQTIGLPKRTAWIGDPAQWSQDIETDCINPHGVLNPLVWQRAYKTPWEVHCIDQATRRAAAGHAAARAQFDRRPCEYDILRAWLGACRDTERGQPYPPIIALNEHAAVLHYQHYDTAPTAPGSLLIDAGCAMNGYACDISRTWTHDGSEFAALIGAVDAAQQSLAQAVRPGIAFGDLHHQAHLAIGGVLRDQGLARANAATLVERGVTRAFFPHGLGHLLGLQVHDVGGNLAGPDGERMAAPAEYPHLRLTRTLEPGQVLTIEPGLYFIPALLEPLRAGPAADTLDWPSIDRLTRFGGVRIEDDVQVTESGVRNLTREVLSGAPS